MSDLNKDLFEKLYNKVLHFLSFRPRSEKEIKDYLSKKSKKKEIKDKVLAKLIKLDLINDKDFVDWWIDQRMSFKPKGLMVLRRELLLKGVDRDLIEEKLSTISNQQLVNLARGLIKKKSKIYGKLSPLKFRKKLSSFLARRGFDWQTINLVIDEFLRK